MLTTTSSPQAREALEEFHLLLRDCSADHVIPRSLPARYQICRTALLSSELKDCLPGFVRQCMSLLKFREFIHLYDHDTEQRVEFLDRSLRPCWVVLGLAPPRGARSNTMGGSQSDPLPPHSQGASKTSPDGDDFMLDTEDDQPF